MFSSKLSPFTVWYENNIEYHHLKNEVFTQDTYYFETDNPAPRIIDAGAHIGLATLYFKKIYPAAQITAIEPHPKNFELLEKNIWQNNLEQVETHNIALGRNAGTQTFFADATKEEWFSTASFTAGAWNGTQISESFEVAVQPLTDFLTQAVDFLKMDIEGAEQEVLTACGKQIRQIKHMMVEWHPVAHQSLPKFIEFLEQNHFKIHFWKDGKEVIPKFTKGLFLIEAEQR